MFCKNTMTGRIKMCYFRTKSLYRPDSHDEVEYFIEWDEHELKNDTSGIKNLFVAKCVMTNKKYEIGRAKNLAEAQKVIDQYHGTKIPASKWIQYCCTLNCNGKKYIIYESWDSASAKYIVSVSRDKGENIYKYSEVSENTCWDALNLTGANLASEILDIAKEDIQSGILDRYIDDCEKFIITEYITDGTRDLLKELWHYQGSRKTFPLILYLFLKAFTDDNGTTALPNTFSTSGEISQCLRGNYNNKFYEICTRLHFDDGIWRFIEESLYIDGQNIISTSRDPEGNCITTFHNTGTSYAPNPYNLSFVAPKLPSDFHRVAKKFIEKNHFF